MRPQPVNPPDWSLQAMSEPPSPPPVIERYGKVAVLLHWVVGLSIIGLLGVGLWMTGLPNSPDKIKVYTVHKCVGLAVLALAALRLIWRATHQPPPLPLSTPRWQVRVAGLTHVLMYALMLAMPLSGWLMQSAFGYPLSWFGLFKVPALIEANKEALAFWKSVHSTLAWSLIVLLALHVAAALKHHFVDRDGLLGRMWFGRQPD